MTDAAGTEGAGSPGASPPAWVEAVRRTGKPHVLLLCGLTGAGKSHLARQLEASLPALRFTVDEWMIALFGEHLPRPVHDERFATLEALTWDTARRTLALGVHVVLDYGFWRRATRQRTAALALEAGATPLVVHLDVPLGELERRLAARNATLPSGTYTITPAMLAAFAARFEPPSEDEGIALVRLGMQPHHALRGEPRR